LAGAQDASSHGGQGGSSPGAGDAGGVTSASGGGTVTPVVTGGSGGNRPDDAAGPSDEASEVATALRAAAACQAAIVAQCERLYVCEAFSVGDCAQYAADRCPQYYFGPHSLRTVEDVEACVPLIRQASCTDVSMGIATQCLLGGRGAAGDPCSSPSECASGSCSALAPSCGTCAVPLALGASCDVSTGHCASGTICHPRTRVCVATPLVARHAAAGEPCDTRGDPLVGCEGDLVCVPTKSGGSAGTCTKLPEQGEPCLAVDSLPACAPGLGCGISTAGGVRTSLCGDPLPCGTGFCDGSSFCYEALNAPPVCRPFVAVGDACSRADPTDRPCGPSSLCVAPALPADGSVATDGLCVAINQVDVGGACDSSLNCYSSLLCRSGRCTRFDPASCFAPGDGR
jgi:hypothetical protein